MIGKIIQDLVPTQDNNRNSEGSFITLKDGRILFAYSRYRNCGHNDGAAADIYGMISEDKGETFCDPFCILTKEEMNADNIMSVSFLRMENGDIGLFFLTKRNIIHCLSYLMRSSDEGKTWSTPILCSEAEGYFVVNNDRVIRTAGGRILIPAALHASDVAIDNNGNKVFKETHHGVLCIFASDDDGFTWKTIAKDISMTLSRGSKKGVQEPGLLQLEDGTVWCYIRNDTGRQYECFSRDDGVSWTTPVPSAFTSAVSPLSARRLSDGRIVAVWNPIPLYNGRSERIDGVWTGARTPLVLAISTDDGETFSEPIPLETDERSGFCYVAIHQVDDSLLLAYCAGGVIDGSTLNRLRIRKLSIREL